MARTPKDTVDYFPHDAHASAESATLAVLEGQFGNDGYAFWFKLLETLACANGHFLEWIDGRRLQVFCGKVHITEDKGVEMLNLLVGMGGIDKELWVNNKVIWCQHLVDNLADVYGNRRRGIPLKPLSTPHNLLTTCRNLITTPDKAIPSDERKGKETKGKDTPLNPPVSQSLQISKTTEKKTYGEFQNVLLSEEEFQKLKDKFGAAAEAMIEKLSAYMESRKKRYSSHYATILNWSRRDDGKAKLSRDLPRQYTDSPDYPDLK